MNSTKHPPFLSASARSLSKSVNDYINPEQRFRGAYSKEMFETLGWAYRPFYRKLAFLLMLGWVGRLFLMANTLVIGWWIDSIAGRSLPRWVSKLSGAHYFQLLIYLSILGFALTLVFRIGFSRTSVKAISSIYDEVTLRVSRYPIRFFDRTPVGRIVTRFSSDYGNMFRMFGGPISEFIGIVFDLLVTSLLLFHVHWLGLILYALLLGLNVGLYIVNKKKIREARREQGLSRSPGVAHFSETVQGSSVIRVFGKKAAFVKRFESLDQGYITAKLNSIRVNISYTIQLLSSIYGVAFLSGVLGLWFISIGYMSPGELATLMVLLNLAGASFQMFFDWMAQFEEAFVGVERMNEYLRLPLEVQSALPLNARFETGHLKEQNLSASAQHSHGARSSRPHSISLELKNVSFRYHNDQSWVLQNLSLAMSAGEKVGIIGRTGAGKTSIFHLLQGFYPVEQGALLFDGKVCSIAQARSYMALVPQDPILFNSTIKDNLSLDPSLSNDRLMSALENVGLEHWLERHADPLLVQVEEKGSNLSLGERQLLVMARMSLIERPLILMDEATSSVDPKTEERLVRAMRIMFKGRTQIIIAHRLSTIESCDRVLWLKNGNVELFDRPEIVLGKFKNVSQEIGA